jgi:hypothetical protein
MMDRLITKIELRILELSRLKRKLSADEDRILAWVVATHKIRSLEWVLLEIKKTKAWKKKR